VSRKWTRRPGLIAVALVVLVFSALILTTITSVIWPGEAKVFAPLFCDDAQPDAFVVRDTYTSGTGETAMNFTLYCVGPRGDHRDAGWFGPFLVMTVANAVVIVLLVVALVAWSRFRRKRRPPSSRRITSTSDAIT
jgi:membrane protein implicated in regulation of membrane protease activity